VLGRYFVLAAGFRFLLEFVRVNAPVLGPFTVGHLFSLGPFTVAQLFSLAVVMLGVALLRPSPAPRPS
jgi:prolipoprotein diacylglyceryltransferase